VRREPCSQDRRGAYAILTEAGLARLGEAHPTHLAGVHNQTQVLANRTTKECTHTFSGAVPTQGERLMKGMGPTTCNLIGKLAPTTHYFRESNVAKRDKPVQSLKTSGEVIYNRQ
jgi:hypothetical protein